MKPKARIQRLMLGKPVYEGAGSSRHRKYVLLGVLQETPELVRNFDVLEKYISQTGLRTCGGLLGATGKGVILTAHHL